MSPYDLKQDFYTEVLTESQTAPVVVDFWAEWCGPCRILGPILEKLAAEAAGKWKLVKVDTERNPEIAAHYQIQAIPSVLLFQDGNPVAEFQGALPESKVREWLARNLPQGNGEPATEKDAALDALQAGRRDQAEAILRKAIAKDGTDYEARILLARLSFTENPDAAGALVSDVPEEDESHDTAMQILHLSRLVAWARTGSSEHVNPAEGSEEEVALYREGARLAGEGKFADALEGWLDLVGRNRKLDGDGARRACVAVFALLGGESNTTQEYRRRLTNLLY